MPINRATSLGFALWCLVAPILAGCERPADSPAPDKITVYCSVDEVFARTILAGFQEKTGLDVAVVFDSEAGKTTGLINRIIEEAESGRPRADVFWSGEVFGTILLGRRGLLRAYDSPAAVDIPARFRDPQHRWTGVAARARVLAYDPAKSPAADLPTEWEALAEEGHAKRLALANPLFGTTRGHVAAMFALWGPGRARAFLTKLRDAGAVVVDGNSAAVRAVMTGRAALAATDTDDIFLAQKSGASLDMAYPDMGGGGTLVIPCTVAMLRAAPNAEAAERLVDFLVSAEAERLLAKSDSRNMPVRDTVRVEIGLAWPAETPVDYDAVADAMDVATAAVREILIR